MGDSGPQKWVASMGLNKMFDLFDNRGSKKNGMESKSGP